MKKCQAITKGGATCSANGAHIVMVWALNSVAYPQDKLPQLYANHGWVLQALNFCGAHRNILIGGKPVNISSTTPVEVNKPKEGINMTKVNNSRVFGCVCEGTGIDPDFQAPCKCTQEVGISEITERQAKFLADLTQEIKANMGGDMKLTWTEVKTKAEATSVIDLTIKVKHLSNMVKSKEQMLSKEQLDAIKAKVEDKPTVPWINSAMKKLATIGMSEVNTGISIWRQAKINGLVKELSSKLSDEQKARIKAKMATEGDDWADKAITQLLKIKSS